MYEIAVKTKQQLDSAQMKIKKMSKILKSRKRRSDCVLSMASAKRVDMATQVAEAPVSPLSNNWANLLLELRSQSSLQMQEMRATIDAKDSQLKYQKKEIERLAIKVATLTHDNNLAHLSLQQNLPTDRKSVV